MEIKINDKFYLHTDQYSFIIATKDRDGKFDNIGYYGRLEQALDRLLDKGLMQSTVTTLEGLKAEIQKIRAEIREVIGKLTEVK